MVTGLLVVMDKEVGGGEEKSGERGLDLFSCYSAAETALLPTGKIGNTELCAAVGLGSCGTINLCRDYSGSSGGAPTKAQGSLNISPSSSRLETRIKESYSFANVLVENQRM